MSEPDPLPIVYSAAARDDLTKVTLDLSSERGVEFARSYVANLRSRIETLSTSPKRYRVRPRYGKGVRLRPELPYNVFYQANLDHVLVVRILHGRRKITRRTIEHQP